MKADGSHRPPGGERRGGVSPITVKRLSLYLRQLEELAEDGRSTISSRQLSKALGLTDAQVRKDLAYFGQFGRPGVGYQVAELADHLRSIFGTDRISHVAVVGVGNLGSALLRYRGWMTKGFRVVAAFDSAASKIGRKFGNITVQPMSKLAAAARAGHIRLAILAVPAAVAQKVADEVCRAGIEGILNFAPITLSLPPEVAVIPVDLAVQLEQLSYLANPSNSQRKRNPGSRRRRQS